MTAQSQPAVPVRPIPRWAVAVVCLLGTLTVGWSALDLSAFGLARYLNSDFLTPYFFCRDVLAGRYPLSGWTLSASPYFVPDHLLLCGLFAAGGPTARAYALFTPAYYLALCVLAGGCVKIATGRTGSGVAGGLCFGSVLLALRLLPGHALALWWIGAPCCHGGTLLIGLAYLWTLGAGLRRGAVGRLPAGLFCLGFIGLLSDTLFLFQILLPASVAIFLLGRGPRRPELARWWRWQAGCGLSSLACTQLFKPLCWLNGWFYFSRILRVSPTPAHQWHALGQFVSDVPSLWRDNWGFAVVLLAAGVLAWSNWRRGVLAGTDGGTLNFFRLVCAASLLIMLPLPILTCAWKDANNLRYLFNWLVLPGLLLTVEIAARLGAMSLRRWHLAAAGAAFAVCLLGAAANLRREPLRFQYPDDVAALDALLQRRGLCHGLAQYWNAKELTALSHAGAVLHQVRANGEPFFWDNNVFGYYEREADGSFAWPAVGYILTNGLDERALAAAYGEPPEKARAGRYQVWIYAPDGQRRIRDALEPAVRQKLGPLRLPKLRLPG